MDRYTAALDQMKYSTVTRPFVPMITQYVFSGDQTAYLQLRERKTDLTHCYWHILCETLSSPEQFTDIDCRIIHLLILSENACQVGRWLNRHLGKEAPSQDFFGVLRQTLEANGIELALIQRVVAEVTTLARRGIPTSVGRYLLALPDGELSTILKLPTFGCGAIVGLFLDHAPERLRPHIDGLLKSRDAHIAGEIAGLLLRKAPVLYESFVAAAFDIKATKRAFCIGKQLVEYDCAKYGRLVLDAARKNVDDNSIPWILKHYGAEVVDELVTYFRTRDRSAWVEIQVLQACMSALGSTGIPVYLQALTNKEEATRLTAVGCLAVFDDGSQAELVKKELANALQSYTGQTLTTVIGYVARWNPAVFEDELWAFTGNKSKPVRVAAARALAPLGERIEPKAVALLGQKKADARQVAVSLLARMGTPRALAVLEARLDEEEQDEIRDAILAGLQAAWAAEGKTLSRAQVEERLLRNAGKLRWPPASWLEKLALPPLYYLNGDEVPADAVRFLLSRQASTKEIVPSLEVQPLYALLDRSRSGAFATTVYHSFVGSGADAKDRWALTVAGVLGDDRLATEITAQIHKWAESSRGKLAEWAVQALALLGTDAALMLVDALAMRYRTKMKNIGTAAVEAFAAAANARGMTPEELGDRVVPWLGFAPGKLREIAAGETTIQARVGLDFKFTFFDVKKNKKVASLPAAVPAEVKAEYKELGALLREVVKAQMRRMENLMVRQHRWPVARWQELFLGHPLLKPFAVRLVWGAYGADGALLLTFQALEDGSLTNAEDEDVTLPDDCAIGIVHPLELGDEGKEAWTTHCADYEIQSPFSQLDRPVVFPEAAQRDTRFYTNISGTSINGMTFKGRAERLGWRRGSVCDAGGITSYWKSFPAAGVDAFLLLEGMFVGIDMYSEITLQQAYFVRAGSVKVGSYEYDEPGVESDERLIAFGAVPAIVYSEVMGDLGRIAGVKAEEEE